MQKTSRSKSSKAGNVELRKCEKCSVILHFNRKSIRDEIVLCLHLWTVQLVLTARRSLSCLNRWPAFLQSEAGFVLALRYGITPSDGSFCVAVQLPFLEVI